MNDRRVELGDLFALFPSLPGVCRHFRVPARPELKRGIAATVGPVRRPSTIPRRRPQIALPPRRRHP